MIFFHRDVGMRIKKLENKHNDVNDNIDYLVKKLEDKNEAVEKIKEIEDVRFDLKTNVEKLHHKLRNFLL